MKALALLGFARSFPLARILVFLWARTVRGDLGEERLSIRCLLERGWTRRAFFRAGLGVVGAMLNMSGCVIRRARERLCRSNADMGGRRRIAFI
jgi:hypothetical protein